ncbi:zinc finger protein-domain-containing protein [Penicillium frequentans]|nr:zinc finger protein-domain-containing protein [Penicillium glabrum]
MDHLPRSKKSPKRDLPSSLSSSLHADLDWITYCSRFLDQEQVGYRAIGFGQCGIVFERPGRGFVLKVAKPSYEDSLWADFKAHSIVRQAFEQQSTTDKPIECRVPRVFSYVAKNNKKWKKWWKENGPLLPFRQESISIPAMTLITQRILPLPKLARDVLIKKYCPDTSRKRVTAHPTNRDCLARVYLGRRRTTTAPSAKFTLRNFNLHLDQMIELGLPVKNLAIDIGEALAVVHWSAHVDGYDIEFVLGSEESMEYTGDLCLTRKLTMAQLAAMSPHTDIESLMPFDFEPSTTRLWILDFHLCNIWDESVALKNPDTLISHLVLSFFENDPYYPLPLLEDCADRELWKDFSTAYVQRAHQVIEGKDPRLATLPQRFIDGCVQRERRSLEYGLGHGHREWKQ